MEANGMLPGMPPGLLGLEMPLQQQQQHQNQPQHHQPHHHHHQQQHLVSFSNPIHDGDHHSQQSQAPKHGYPFAKGKQQPAFSDEDEPGFAEEGGEAAVDGRGKRISPWQRMKWTDNMVRLLIMVVFFVGDECGSETNEPNKKKHGLLQKKGKWKSVSRAMMEKGFCVSPQQCEDKFNDLNKRYKRVNDILGKGTACRVVENQNLLDSMDHLSSKMKEEVRKLLNSKHLFFREMCAYHSSGGGGAQHQSCEVDSNSRQQQQQRCLLLPDSGAVRSRAEKEEEEEEGVEREEGDEDDDDEDDDDDDDDEDDEEEIVGCDGEGSKEQHGGGDDEEGSKLKRQRRAFWSVQQQQLSSELNSVMQDGNRSVWEQRQWIRKKSVQLEEQRVSYQLQAFELEKQRFKWQKFSGKKERELERLKLENERMNLENDRMALVLRQKEAELDLKRSPGSITG